MHGHNRSKTGPHVGHQPLDALHQPALAVGAEEPHHRHNTHRNTHVEPHRREHARHPRLDRRVLVEKPDKRLHLHEKDQQREQRHHHRIGEAVRHHRPQHLAERRLLALGHIAAAPHLAQAGKEQVHGIHAEDGIDEDPHRRGYLQGAQLQPPAQRPGYMTENGHPHREDNPKIIDIGFKNLEYGLYIELLVDIPEQPYAAEQRKQIFYNIADYPFQFSRFKNLLYLCMLQR